MLARLFSRATWLVSARIVIASLIASSLVSDSRVEAIQDRQSIPVADLATRAAAARESGQLDEALRLYREALAARPDFDEGRWYVGTLLYELDRYSEAKDAFSEVLRREPAHAGALGMKGLCEFELRQYEAALTDLLQARQMGVARSPGIATVVRYHAAILLTRAGEFEVANQILIDFVADGTETPPVIEALGLNVLRMPMLPSEAPGGARDRILLAGRAGYAMAARHAAEARAALDELVTRYPGIPHVHYARGVFFLIEDSDRALADFERELTISPAHVPARLQIAFEYLKRGDAARALPVARDAAQLAPDHFAAHLALGQVLTELNDTERAIPELEKAVALAPGSPQTHYILARAYARAGRTADAERTRAEFTRLDQIVRATRQGSQAVGGIPSAGPVRDR
jgi:tetratricopeptide (TPR) repeat protein